MAIAEALATGLILGGFYALIALGFNLQYGVARIVNLAYGEFLVVAALATFSMYKVWHLDPYFALALCIPVSFGVNWLVYRLLLTPLARRARVEAQLEGDSVLATFGILFIIQGVAFWLWSADTRYYNYFGHGLNVFGLTFAANRFVAFAAACVIAGAIYLFMTRTREGTALRAMIDDPVGAGLVGVNLPRLSALAFAAGGSLAAASGTLVSTYLSFSPALGVVFTMKALVVAIMGGIGNMLGGLVAGLLLGVAEALCARFVDSGLTLAVTYALFLLVLLLRPRGLFGTT